MRNLAVLTFAGMLLACGGDDDGPAAGMDSGTAMDAGGGGTDAATGTDGGGGTDAGVGTDAGDAVDGGGGTDAGDGDGGTVVVDAGTCSAIGGGACPGGTMCLCCPAGGPVMNCLCTTACRDDGDCDDAARPVCNRPTDGPGGGAGICTPPMYRCAWGSACASPDTPIATPGGERAIAELAVGDLVYSVHDEQLVAVPLREVSRTAVRDHRVVEVQLGGGAVVAMSAGHPTIDGRTFGSLAVGDDLGGATVVAVREVPFAHPFTHDIRPDSDTGYYVAAGALVASTRP